MLMGIEYFDGNNFPGEFTRGKHFQIDSYLRLIPFKRNVLEGRCMIFQFIMVGTMMVKVQSDVFFLIIMKAVFSALAIGREL